MAIPLPMHYYDEVHNMVLIISYIYIHSFRITHKLALNQFINFDLYYIIKHVQDVVTSTTHKR